MHLFLLFLFSHLLLLPLPLHSFHNSLTICIFPFIHLSVAITLRVTLIILLWSILLCIYGSRNLWIFKCLTFFKWKKLVTWSPAHTKNTSKSLFHLKYKSALKLHTHVLRFKFRCMCLIYMPFKSYHCFFSL